MSIEERIKAAQEKCKILRLSGIRAQLPNIIIKAQSEKMVPMDLVDHMWDVEIDSRKRNRLKTCLKHAGLTEPVSLDDFQLKEGCGLTPYELKVLEGMLWAHEHYNLIIIGASGIGKTKLVQGLATIALAENYRSLYLSGSKFLNILKNKDHDSRCEKQYKSLKKMKILFIDDIDQISMSADEALECKALVDEINKTASIVLTASTPVKDWKTVFFNEQFGVSVVSRLSERCETITLVGKSYRIIKHQGFFEKFARVEGPNGKS